MATSHLWGSVKQANKNQAIILCVPQMGEISRGVAGQLVKEFKLKEPLQILPRDCPSMIPIRRQGRLFLALIVKTNEGERAAVNNISRGLRKAKDYLLENEITKVAMTPIGCDEGEISFSFLMLLLERVLNNNGISIDMFHQRVLEHIEIGCRYEWAWNERQWAQGFLAPRPPQGGCGNQQKRRKEEMNRIIMGVKMIGRN